MTTLTIDLPEEKMHRLEALARARGGTNVARLLEEMSSLLLAEADAEEQRTLRLFAVVVGVEVVLVDEIEGA